ncbi:MAG: hypothetical protein ACRBDX_08130 [Gammaproteobacteria bacterium]
MPNNLKRKVTKLEAAGSILIVSLMFGGIIVAQHYSKFIGSMMTLSSIVISTIAYFIYQRIKNK